MFLSIYLNSLFLNMPTMNINKGDEEDSDDEEEVLISERGIDVVTHARRAIDVSGTKMPMTISLLGVENVYVGLKVVLFNSETLKEEGVFFTVDSKKWELSEEEKGSLPKKRATKRDVLECLFHLPDVLRKNGFDTIYKTIEISPEKKLYLRTPFEAKGRTDVFENVFSHLLEQ